MHIHTTNLNKSLKWTSKLRFNCFRRVERLSLKWSTDAVAGLCVLELWCRRNAERRETFTFSLQGRWADEGSVLLEYFSTCCLLPYIESEQLCKVRVLGFSPHSARLCITAVSTSTLLLFNGAFYILKIRVCILRDYVNTCNKSAGSLFHHLYFYTHAPETKILQTRLICGQQALV